MKSKNSLATALLPAALSFSFASCAIPRTRDVSATDVAAWVETRLESETLLVTVRYETTSATTAPPPVTVEAEALDDSGRILGTAATSLAVVRDETRQAFYSGAAELPVPSRGSIPTLARVAISTPFTRPVLLLAVEPDGTPRHGSIRIGSDPGDAGGGLPPAPADPPTSLFGVQFLDADGDGDLDLVVTSR